MRESILAGRHAAGTQWVFTMLAVAASWAIGCGIGGAGGGADVVDPGPDLAGVEAGDELPFDAVGSFDTEAIPEPGSDVDAPMPGACYYPPSSGDEWETILPSDLGWDTTKLEEAVQYVGEHNSTAFLVLYRGRIVLERYWQGWGPHSHDVIASAAKSVMAFLCGLAVQDGKLDLSKPVSSYLGAGWSTAPSDKEAAITVRHLLTMTSGLDESLAYEADAGTRWFYNTPAYYLLEGVLTAATGVDRDAYSEQRLHAVIGMQDSGWASKSLSASGRDMARFGLMILGGGTWDGQTLMTDEGYFDQMLDTSQALNPSYGYLWWLNGRSSFLLPGSPAVGGQGALIPDAPPDLVGALGKGDKRIYVVKSLDLVVVRHGDATDIVPQDALSSFDNALWQRLMAALP
jgi:CubicO group peptidase (beta-lactamase class C family)